jgi:hypothetical protein
MRVSRSSRTRALAIALTFASAVAAGALSSPVAASRAVAAARTAPQDVKPRTDNLVALEMGGRFELQPERPGELAFVPERALDGDPKTMWATLFPPDSLVLSFVGRDTALVSTVSITSPDPKAPAPYMVSVPGARPAAVEIALSTTSAKAGFVKAISASLPNDDNEHVVTLPAPTEARFVKLTFSGGPGAYGKNGVVVGEIAVHEGTRAGYTPLLQRHPDLQALLSSGSLKPDPASLAYQAPGSAASCVVSEPAKAVCPESKSVLVVTTAPSMYLPPHAGMDPNWKTPEIRYFAPGPGKGLVDESIFKREDYWMLQASMVRPAAFVPSAHIDTVVFEQVCDIKTSLSAAAKQALVAWVANGNKLIISDSDSCGPGQVPDYSFLPYQFATSNPGGRAAASALQVLEQNFLVSPDSHDPAFFDEPSWREKKNGNAANDFGDSNTVVQYDDHWCGALFGTNAIGGSGFVMAYAHYGRGVIIYDGIDRDQYQNLAYQQYSARQLLLPFRPDPLPCSLRVAPFAVTTDVSLVHREIGAGQTVTYPLTIIGAKPDFAGTVALSVVPPAGSGVTGHVDPVTVSLGKTASATLSITAPAAIAKPVAFAVQGSAGGATGTLCLTIDGLTRGHLTVTADPPPPAPPAVRKNLLVILDLSGSMNLALGKATRIATARQVLKDLLAHVPDDTNVGLRVYGDRFASTDKRTCTDSHLAAPVQTLDRAGLTTLIDTAKPRGETPLVYSVTQAIGDLKAAGGGSIALITDGEESCGGNFAAAAAALKASGLAFKLNIVGFTLKGVQAQKSLSDLASSTGGAYYAASDGPALARALNATIDTFPFTVIDAAGKTVAQGVAGDRGVDLPAGEYTVAVDAGSQHLTLTHVAVVAGQPLGVRVARTANGFAISRQ